MTQIVNSEAAQFWNGPNGDHWAREWEHHDRTLAAYHRRMLDAANPQPGEDALDIGCGNGQLSRDLARIVDPGTVLGLDLSTSMLARASSLARVAGIDNVKFVQADIQSYPFAPDTFDLAVSRFGAMFFADPVAAFANIGVGCRPGARLVMVAWQPEAANEWISEIRGALRIGGDLPDFPATGTPGPFGLADPDRTVAVLTAAGYRSVDLEALADPMWVGPNPSDAVQFNLSTPNIAAFIAGLGLERADRVRAALQDIFDAHETPEGVIFGSAAWLIRARWAG